MFNHLLTYLSFTEPLKYCQQDHAKRLRKSQTVLEKWRTPSINDVPPVQVQQLGNKTQLLLQPSWHYGRSGSVTVSFPIILSNLLVEQNLLFFFNEHSYACCSGHSQCQNMPVHYHISEKLKVMNNLVKWIWLRENHAGKLKWFVLTSLPPKTFSKPTPSWGTNSDKNMFSKEKNCPCPKHLFCCCSVQNGRRFSAHALRCYCHWCSLSATNLWGKQWPEVLCP